MGSHVHTSFTGRKSGATCLPGSCSGSSDQDPGRREQGPSARYFKGLSSLISCPPPHFGNFCQQENSPPECYKTETLES